jgi:chromosomal replication initiator protein
VIVFASMNNVPMSREVAAQALSDVFAPADVVPTMADVLRATARHFGLDGSDLTSKGRRQELVAPRQIAMYLIRDLTSHSFPEIGEFFGGRDHSTVLYAVKKIQERLDDDAELAKTVAEVRASLS